MRLIVLTTLAVAALVACGDSSDGGDANGRVESVDTATATRAESASDVAEEALERYAERAEGIESFTVVQEVAGQETTQRFVKTMVDGYPVFQPEGSAPSGNAAMSDYSRMLQRARETGTERVGGVETRTLVVEDFSGLTFGPEGSETFQPERMTLYIDTEEYLPRKMEIAGEVVVDSQPRPVTTTITLEDYQIVEGFMYPYRTTVQAEGLMGAMGDDDRAEMERQLEEFDRRMEEMPAEQRRMAERAMGPRVEQMRRMMESGALEQTVVVKELRVNTEPGS